MPIRKISSYLSAHSKLAYFIMLISTYLLFLPVVMEPVYNLLLFHPDKKYYPQINEKLNDIAKQFSTNIEDVFIPVKDGAKIHGWYFKANGKTKTFLISHGNGGNICYRLPLIVALLKYGSVFIYDYEGYGSSNGTPLRRTICNDGLAAYDYLITEQHIKPIDIVLYGESLGCAVSCVIAQNRTSGGVILQSGWTSLLAVARDRMVLPRLYPDFFFSEPHLNNLDILRGSHSPLLLIHGQKDQILSCRYSKELFTQASEPKKLVLLPNASHNDVIEADNALYSQNISDFLKSL